MKPTLIIQGNLEQASQLIQLLLVADLPVDCVVMPNTLDDTPRYQSLVVASTVCAHLNLRVGTAADYGQAHWVVILDRSEEHTPQVERVAELRRLLNHMVENGFKGQLVFAGREDDVLTSFASHFSGLPTEQIWGLGTYPLTRLLAHRLADQLGLGAAAIRATVVGSAANPTVAWSRTYVGPTPILMYLANEDAKFSGDDLSKVGNWLRREATEQLETLRLLGLIHLLQAILAEQPVIETVTNIQPGEETYAAATPILVNATGVHRLTNLVLSEDEQQDYAAGISELKTTITAIEGQQTEGK